MLEYSKEFKNRAIGGCIPPGKTSIQFTDTLIESWSELFALAQRSQYKSTNIHKLEAAVKLYTGLAQMPAVQRKVTSKLCSMLLHPYPIVCYTFQ